MKKIIDRIFPKKKVDSDSEATLPMLKVNESTQPVKISKYHPEQYIVGTAQSVGMQRDHNEDALFAMNTMIVDGEENLPFGIFVVADGMGGHESGEVASSVTVRSMADYLINHLYLPLVNNNTSLSDLSLDTTLTDAVNATQKAVSKKAPGGGTTLTTAVMTGKSITFAHVGDSRAYFISPDGTCEIITHDHTLVQRLQDMGQITEEDASVHPQRNVLYRAIGQSEPFNPDLVTRATPKPGYLLLCSDGLWGVVPKQNIVDTVLKAECPSEACHQLVRLANQRGGPDNITVVLIQIL